MKFNVEECKKSDDTYEHISAVVKSIPLAQVKKDLGKKFYKSEEVIEFLYSVLTSRGNGILHGPGGFGKSQITKEFLAYFDIPCIVKVGNSATDVESILGIPNIEKLTKESEYEIAFEKSVFALPGVLVLEEFLDVRPTVAAALKDILSEGGYRQGNGFMDSKVGSVIICSNKTPEEVSIDLSTAAFYKERFPYSSYVCWEDFSYTAFYEFYKLVYGEEVEDNDKYQLLADICSSSCTNDAVISPRIAIKARDLFLTSGSISNLKYLASIDYSKIEEVEHNLRERNFYKVLFNDVINIRSLIMEYHPTTGDEYLGLLSYMNTLKSSFKKSNIIGDALIKEVSSLLSLIEIKITDLKSFTTSRGSEFEKSIPGIGVISKKICSYLNH